MKQLFLVAAAFIALSAFKPLNNVWTNDDYHSQLGFTVTHLGLNDVSGVFNDFDVNVTATKPDFSDAQVEMTAKIASISTRIDPRDTHLKSADFFDAEKFPTMSYKSTAIKKAGKGKYKLTGDLTLHGVTKQVVMDFNYKGTTENPMSKKTTVGLQVTGTIKRSDFGIGANFPAVVVSDEVRIKADGEFTQN